jgi:hypothetical protein
VLPLFFGISSSRILITIQFQVALLLTAATKACPWVKPAQPTSSLARRRRLDPLHLSQLRRISNIFVLSSSPAKSQRNPKCMRRASCASRVASLLLRAMRAPRTIEWTRV